MKQFILTTIAATVLAISAFGSGATTLQSIDSVQVNKISTVDKIKLEDLRTLVLNAGGTFKTTTYNGEFKSLHITKNALTIVIKDDSSILLLADGKKVKASLNQIIEEFTKTIQEQTKI